MTILILLVLLQEIKANFFFTDVTSSVNIVIKGGRVLACSTIMRLVFVPAKYW
jgi:hypothetical protein